MEFHYLLAKQAVLQKNVDASLYPFMVCSLYGLLSKYKGYEPIVLDLFSMTNFYIEEGTVPEILKKHHIEMDFTTPIDDSDDEYMKVLGASNQGHSFVQKDDGTIRYQQDYPFVICSLNCQNPSRILNAFCHEMGHLIKGEKDSVWYYGEEDVDPIYVIRTGLAHYSIGFQDHFQKMIAKNQYLVLDESINCIQTTDVMQEILALKEFCPDPEIVSYIDSLDADSLKEDIGYQDMVQLLRLFWNQESFRGSIEDNIVEGNIDAIIHSFDSLMEQEGAFDQLSEWLEDVFLLAQTNRGEITGESVDNIHKMAAEYKKRVKSNKKED